MIVKLLTEHNLEFLSLTGGCRGSAESTLVKISNCWKSHSAAQGLHTILIVKVERNKICFLKGYIIVLLLSENGSQSCLERGRDRLFLLAFIPILILSDPWEAWLCRWPSFGFHLAK